MIKKYWKIILISFVAVLIRVIAFGEIPGGMNQDGAMAAVDAEYLAQHATDRLGMFMPVHFTAWGFGQMSVLMSYMMVPFIKLFGLNTIIARLPMLLSSLLGLVALYFVSKKLFNKKIAIIVLAVAAINPWHIMQSRWALDCNLFPHFFLFAFYLLICKKYHASMLMFGLCMYCYGVSIYCIPIFLIISCIYLLNKRLISAKNVVICIFCYLLVAWPFITCMVINAFGGDTISLSFCTIPYFKDSIRSSDLLFLSSKPLTQLWQNMICLVKIVFQVSQDLPSNKIDGFETMYYLSIPFFIIGFVRLFKRFFKKTGATLLCFWFVTAILTGLITNNVNINRINIIFYPMIIFTGIGLYTACSYINNLKFPVIAAYLLAFSFFAYSYFTNYANTIKYVFLEDFGQALTYASSIDADSVYVTPNSQMKGTWYVSEILAMYYCDDYSSEKYTYTDKENADVLILDEPEPGAVQFGRFFVITR